MDIDDFDIDRSTDEAWDAFSGRLSEVLSMMDSGAELTLGVLAPDEGGSPFIAYGCPALGRIRAEASSNAVLADDQQLAAPQLAQMEQLGWSSPSAESSENFFSEWSQERTDELAGLSVATLRDVYGVLHPVFLTADQLADVLQPPGPSEPPYLAASSPEEDEPDTHAVMPADAAELDRLVGAELARIYGSEPFHDSEGDYSIRVGSTMVFVRVPSDAREVIAFAAVVHDVSGRSRAAEVLNDLNSESRWVRFWLLRDKVFVSMSALAKPFVPAHFRQVVHEVASVADTIDEHLAAALQGRTTFSSPEA
ncbi:MAG TPA: YbjN domain-containing protein [Propionibacteriaceae bacterium]|nr:YbjN domain-containing protein [Propionibacteriaceae bacterium]